MNKIISKVTETKNIFINLIFTFLILFCAISIVASIVSTVNLF